jgi:predicted SAM-dependent methyltransferase
MKDLILDIYRKVPLLAKIYRPLRAARARSTLKRKVCETISSGRALNVVIGANGKFQPGWIPTEIYTLNCLRLEDWERYFPPASIDRLIAEHVWEHLLPEDGLRMAILCWQYLKPGGLLRVAVPDGFFPDDRYIQWVKPGGSGPSADDHKILYTYPTFGRVFETAGFEVTLREFFDEKGEFHYSEWDPQDGKIVRSMRFYDGHQFGQHKYRSLILDAHKPPKPLLQPGSRISADETAHR